MPATLDAAAYPHILDGVLAHAPYPALLLLRRVSQSTKRKADARLASHVILHMPDFGPPVSTGERYLREYDDRYCCDRVRSLTLLSLTPGERPPAPPPPSTAARPTGSVLSPGAAGDAYAARFPRAALPPAIRLPGLMRWWEVASPERAMRAERGLRAGMVMNVGVLDAYGRARRSVLERCLRAVEDVRVVDVPGLEAAHLARGAGFGATDMLGALKPRVVRYHSAWGPGPFRWGDFPDAARRVLFVPLLRGERGWFVPTGVVGGFAPTGFAPTGEVGRKRIVVHFTGAGAVPPGILVPQHVERRADAEVEVVLIFSGVGGGEVLGEDGEGDGEGERGNPWQSATAALVAYLPCAEVTLVDAVPVLGARDEVVPALERVARKRRQESNPTDPDDELPLARIRLLARDEYRQEVGEEMFALDMVGLAET